MEKKRKKRAGKLGPQHHRGMRTNRETTKNKPHVGGARGEGTGFEPSPALPFRGRFGSVSGGFSGSVLWGSIGIAQLCCPSI